VERRPRRDLYHSALEVHLPQGTYVIESTPIPDVNGAARGVFGEGPVGSRLLGRFRLFRYELRCWLGGSIPDVAEAVDSPRRLTEDEATARHVLELTTTVPTPVWGRDELHAGEMWNSNSVIAWLVARAGLPVEEIELPANGRAPGWNAGVVVARRGASTGAGG
jgi:hypothetical protein